MRTPFSHLRVVNAQERSGLCGRSSLVTPVFRGGGAGDHKGRPYRGLEARCAACSWGGHAMETGARPLAHCERLANTQ